ncbi:ABC transporter substrate-binding protein [Phaeobacter gallaeciensis]|uniref:ABC transporter substrate-binding protein n=2 Tax=Roseobacteraceae TaxID=2854170 RepID=A0A366X2S0_9RHOB|nr:MULTISPECIES: ABC transporter substrate-binding protein [Roseobacteraceae]MBT3143209.1 ABC transporter substrate-binding protein [Falsiruegeria litorea]MBT8167612.1 ABC transporter substrate-binding protein [Falsiruegeria litorea]RBW57991.1 ABC transporter substrate-binding protein [Phaeobacter gallaeciensis]
MKLTKTLTAFTLGATMAASAAFAEGTLTYAGSGGGLAQVMKGVFDDPFTADTGIAVNALATSDRASALKAMQVAGKVTWDVTELNPIEYATASLSGWLAPLDWSVMDPNNALPDDAKLADAGIAATFSTVMAVRTDKLPEGKQMTSWADFWNVEGFPGGRALQNQPIDNLEFALIADGVAPADVYTVLATEEGQDRAFAKLDEIKPHIAVWWTAGAQPVQMLSDGEVAYTSAWNGRITKLAAEGVPVTINWNGGGIKASYVAIVKGSENVEAGQKYISFMMTSPERAAQFASMVPYPGMVKGLYDHIPPEKGAMMPTHPNNVGDQFVTNALFWGKNLGPLNERWEDWILE